MILWDFFLASEEEKKLQALLLDAYRWGVPSEGRTRSTRNASNKKKSSSSSTAKKSKSSEDDEEDKEEKEPKKKKRKVGPSKMHVLSPALANFLGADEMARTDVVKMLHHYIKENKLQNPQNKREILFDNKLQEVFKTKKTDYFKINKLISQHAKPADEVV